MIPFEVFHGKRYQYEVVGVVRSGWGVPQPVNTTTTLPTAWGVYCRVCHGTENDAPMLVQLYVDPQKAIEFARSTARYERGKPRRK